MVKQRHEDAEMKFVIVFRITHRNIKLVTCNADKATQAKFINE